MSEKKQYPFRYPEELEEDFKTIFELQGYCKKKNQAIQHAVKIAAAYIKKKMDKRKKEENYWDLREKIKKDLNVDI